jgi:signal transduction histidine kinase
VEDNGPGIPPDVQEKIFVPFFSTKEDGSGIGLSLSRQIMRLHGGRISVRSTVGEGTTFTLRF